MASKLSLTTTEAISKKFQLDRFTRRALVNLPEAAQELADVEGDRDLLNPPYELIVIFVKDLDVWKKFLTKVSREDLLSEGGVIYFLYPKRGNKVYDTFIHRDDIFPTLKVDDDDGYFQGSDLKFNRMFSLNDVFTVVGVKKLSKRPAPSTGPSQRVGDYEHRLGEVEELLLKNPDALEFYRSLTPGYRRNYARFILGVKTVATKQSRLEKAVRFLEEGRKTP